MYKIWVIFSLLICAASFANKYSLEDLKILSNEKNHTEFLLHAKDVPPTKRGKEWKDMVEKMAIEHLSDLIKNKQFEEKQTTQLKKISTWTSLKQNEFFLSKKREYIYEAAKYCLKIKSYKDCATKIEKSFFQAPSPELGFKLFLLIHKNHPQVVKVRLFPYLQEVIESPLSEFYCKNDVLQDFMRQNISLDFKTPENLKIHEDCKKSIFIKSFSLLGHHQEIIRNRALKHLELYKALSEEDRAFYHLISFLNQKKIEVFTTKYLNILSKNFKLRESLIERTKQVGKIPFGLKNLNKKQSIIQTKLLQEHFPEYVSLQVKICYGREKSRYKEECRKLKEVDKVLNFIPITYKTNI